MNHEAQVRVNVAECAVASPVVKSLEMGESSKHSEIHVQEHDVEVQTHTLIVNWSVCPKT